MTCHNGLWGELCKKTRVVQVWLLEEEIEKISRCGLVMVDLTVRSRKDDSPFRAASSAHTLHVPSADTKNTEARHNQALIGTFRLGTVKTSDSSLWIIKLQLNGHHVWSQNYASYPMTSHYSSQFPQAPGYYVHQKSISCTAISSFDIIYHHN